MTIPGASIDAVWAHARSGYPHEVCGVLLGRWVLGVRRVEEVVAVVNREPDDPRARFQIAPEDLVRVQREARQRGREILGYYHSHPDHPAEPSETDRRVAAEGLSDGVVHLIVALDAGRPVAATAWVFAEDPGTFVEEALLVE